MSTYQLTMIGTYSSIAIAAPILVAYQDWKNGRKAITQKSAKPVKAAKA